jgi:hypothetical protein
LLAAGCATQKESHTARTGVEQLLVSSAIDQSLDKVDLSALRRQPVFLETKYLDCVDKNYIIVSLHRRLLHAEAQLVDKPEAADIILEVASGGVGTDGQDMFVGIPEIPLPPPSPISIPRLAFVERKRLNGTAKLLVVAYDAKSKRPILNPGTSLARSDQNNWNVLGAGPVQSGSVTEEIAAADRKPDLTVTGMMDVAKRSLMPAEKPPEVLPASRFEDDTKPASVVPARDEAKPAS